MNSPAAKPPSQPFAKIWKILAKTLENAVLTIFGIFADEKSQ